MWLNSIGKRWHESSFAESRDVKDYDVRIWESHPSYTKCMEKMYRYRDTKRTAGEDVGPTFKTELLWDDGHAVEVNECRSLSKDYWTLVAMRQQLRTPLSEPQRSKFEAQHRRFKELVPVFEVLDGYDNDGDKAEYDLCFSKGCDVAGRAS